jgi:hypothetical protein
VVLYYYLIKLSVRSYRYVVPYYYLIKLSVGSYRYVVPYNYLSIIVCWELSMWCHIII